MARTKHSDAEKAAILERQLLALDLRKAGFSYRAIGTKLNVSHEQARTDVEKELRLLADRNKDKVDEHRQLELERLDFVTKSLSHWIEAGNTSAAGMYIKASERRAKLLGLDAPAHVILDVDPQLLRQLKAKADSVGVDLAQVFEAMVNELGTVNAAADREE